MLGRLSKAGPNQTNPNLDMKTLDKTTRDYLFQAYSCSYARVIPNQCVLLPRVENKNEYVLVRRLKQGIFFCQDCDEKSKLNLNENCNIREVTTKYCVHSKVAEIFFCKETKPIQTLDDSKDQIFNIQQKPVEINVVFPRRRAQGSPGVVVLSARMTKRRCKTCKGREGCLHLNIFNEAEKEEHLISSLESLRLKEKSDLKRVTKVVTDNIEESEFRFSNKLNRKYTPRETNPLNPKYFNGPEANVFQQEFNYPSTKSDMEKNDKINQGQPLHHGGRMIPAGWKVKKCDLHDNLYSELQLESRCPLIHHSRPTLDSRDQPLAVYCLVTGKCECIEFYSGTEDRLVRSTLAPAKSNQTVNFTSVDLLNDYLSLLFGKSQEGKSLDAFIESLNSLNEKERGITRKIPKNVVFKSFEIYLHTTKYDKEKGFECQKCPKELENNETEEDYPDDIDAHLVDGVNMGCKEDKIKGFVDEEDGG